MMCEGVPNHTRAAELSSFPDEETLIVQDIRRLLPFVEQGTATKKQLHYLLAFYEIRDLWRLCHERNLIGGLTDREQMLIRIASVQIKMDRRRNKHLALAMAVSSCGARITEGGIIEAAQRRFKVDDTIHPKQSPQDRQGAKSDEWGDRSRDRCLTVE